MNLRLGAVALTLAGVVYTAIGFAAEPTAAPAGAADEPKPLSFGGDLTVRYKWERSHTGTPATSAERQRLQHRVRANGKYVASPQTTAVFQLITGKADAASAYQDATGSFEKFPVSLNQLYIAHKPAMLSSLSLGVGKALPMWVVKTSLMFEANVAPAGFWGAYEVKGAGWTVTPLAGSFVVREAAADVDARLSVVQVALLWKGGVDLTVALSHFEWSYLEGRQTLLITGSGVSGYGNTGSALSCSRAGDTLCYDNGFRQNGATVEVVLPELAAGIPLAIVGDYLTNAAAEEHNVAYAAGVKLGKKSAWQIGTEMRRVEADAVVGALTESSFRGGFTDRANAEGLITTAMVVLDKNTTLTFKNMSSHVAEKATGTVSPMLAEVNQVELNVAF